MPTRKKILSGAGQLTESDGQTRLDAESTKQIHWLEPLCRIGKKNTKAKGMNAGKGEIRTDDKCHFGAVDCGGKINRSHTISKT